MIDYYQGVILDLDTELEFGKYQGYGVGYLIDEDPDYIRWLSDQGVDVSDEVMELL